MAVGISSHDRLYRRRGDCRGWVSDTKWEPFLKQAASYFPSGSCVLYRSVLCVLWPTCAQSCSFSCRRLLLLLALASLLSLAASLFRRHFQTQKAPSRAANVRVQTVTRSWQQQRTTMSRKGLISEERRQTPYAIRQTVRTQDSWGSDICGDGLAWEKNRKSSTVSATKVLSRPRLEKGVFTLSCTPEQ